MKKLVIGITGSIGTGKSSAARYLESHGCTLVDVDGIYRKLSGPKSPFAQKIKAAFGPSSVHSDGSLNRDYLRSVVFSDRKKLALLNSLTHPLIIKTALTQIKRAKGNVVVDSPLLLETGMQKVCDVVIVTHAKKEAVIARLQKARGLTREEIVRILSHQMPFSQKKRHANYTVDTSGGYAATHRQLDRVIDALTKKHLLA